MARNGTGTYNLTTGQPVAINTVIDETVFNTLMTDVALALTNSLAANGETPTTAAIPFAAGITLSGSASNFATGANFISYGGTDAGLSFDASNNATLSGTLAINGASLTTNQTTFTAFAGATTLLTLGGTGATSVVAIPGTLDATSSTAAGLKTAGGFAAAKSIFAGNSILSTGPTSGIGYATGAGGAVTQLTSKTTEVTLNKVCGTITMNNAALAAGAVVYFKVTNSAVVLGDVVAVSDYLGGVTAYETWTSVVTNGSFYIGVKNTTAGSRSEALTVNFAVIKAVAA